MLILNVCREETVLGLDLVVVVVVASYHESKRYHTRTAWRSHDLTRVICHNLKSEEKKQRAPSFHIFPYLYIQDFEISTTYSLYVSHAYIFA